MSDYSTEVLALSPVGYWRLGEAAGTNAVDEMGVNDGTYTNTPTLGVTGALTDDLDTAVTFVSANSEYVTMGDVLDFDRNEPFTLACWFKSNTAAGQGLIRKGLHAAPNTGYGVRLDAAGSVSFSLLSDSGTSNYLSTATTATTFGDDAWHFCVATYDGSSTAAGVTIYVDGVSEALTVGTDSLSTTTVTTAPLNIGGRNNADKFFDGEIDEAAIFNIALTARNVARLYYAGLGTFDSYPLSVLEGSPAGYWRLGEAAGTNAADELGINDGTYTNTPTLAETGLLTGDDDTAVSFLTANDEHVALGNVLNIIDGTVPWSITFWVNTSVGGVPMGAYLNNPGTGFLLWANATKVDLLMRNTITGNNEIRVDTSTGLGGVADGNDHFIVITNDGSETAAGISIYIDGVSSGINVVYDQLTASAVTSEALFIGAYQAAATFTGTLDEVALFETELTLAAVSKMYNAGQAFIHQSAIEILALAPINYWKLDELSGNSAKDTMGDKNGSYQNTVDLGLDSPQPRGEYTAIGLNGTDEHVYIGNILNFERTDTFSFSLWVKGDLSALGYVCGNQLNSAPYLGFGMFLRTTGDLVFRLTNTGGSNEIQVATPTSTIAANTWAHVVVTYDGGSAASGMKIYIDGVAQSLTVDADSLSASTVGAGGGFRLGTRNGDQYFPGSLDEVAVFDTELTAYQAMRLYGAAMAQHDYGLEVIALSAVGYWKLDELTGTVADDVTAGDNDGTYTNTPTLGVDGPLTAPGDVHNKAVTFASATDEHVDMGDVLDFDKDEPFTLAAWVKTSSATTQIIVGKTEGVTNFRGYKMGVSSAGAIDFKLVSATAANAIITATTATTFADGAWHFVVATYDGSEAASGVTIYVDGVAEAQTVANDTLTTTTVHAENFQIGVQSADLLPMEGSIDEVSVHNIEITAAQVLALYELGVPPVTVPGLDDDYRNKVLSLRPLGYWRLGEASGTLAADEMLRNDGTYINTPTLAAAGALTDDTDTAVTFVAASSEYVDMGDVLSFDHDEPFTISFWFKTTTTTTQALVRKNTATTDYQGWGTNIIATGAVNFTIVNTSIGDNLINVVTDATTFNDGNWHHAAFTYDGSDNASGCAIFIDGISEALTLTSDTLTLTTISSANFNVGARNNTDIFLDGTVDEVAIFGYELNAKDVAAMYYKGLGESGYLYEVKKLAPTSYWRLGEASGTNAADEMGNNDGTYAGTPTLGAGSLVPVDADTAASFLKSVPEYVGMGDVLDFNHNLPWAFCLWINTTDSAGVIISKWDNTAGKGFLLQTVGATDLVIYLRAVASSNEIQLNYADATHIWDGNNHFLAVTYDGTTNASGLKIYIDGIEQIPTTITADTLSSSFNVTASFNLATRDDGDCCSLTCTLDEVARFDYEPTELEMRNLYAKGLALLEVDSYAREVLLLGPVAYWRLGEAAGTNAADELGTYDGTYTNTPTLGVTGALTGDTDTAATFASASSEYVTMGDVLDFDKDDPYTLSIWFKSSTAADQALIRKRNATYRGYNFDLGSAGKIHSGLLSDASTDFISISTNASTFSDGNWHHAVVTYDGSQTAAGMIIYVDGVAEPVTVSQDALVSTTVNASPLCIGSWDTTTLYFDGELDEVAIFDRELTAYDVARMYYRGLGNTRYALETLAGAPDGYWRLGEASGTVATDEVGTKDGAYVNAPTLGVTSLVPNDGDTAVTFDGATGYVDMDDFFNYAYNAPMSMGCWVNTTDTGTSGIISKYDSAGNKGVSLYITSSTLSFILISVTGTNLLNINVAPDITDGVDHFICVTYDGSTNASGATIYVDGVAYASTVVQDSLTSSTAVTNSFNVAGSDDTAKIAGTVDEAFVAGVELSANQVADMYIASLLSYTAEAAAGGSQYDGAVTEGATIAAVLGASADHAVTDSTALVTILATHWGKGVTESFNIEVGIGIITTLTESFSLSTSIATVRNQIGSVVESIQLALTENIEAAKGIVEGLAMNEAWVGNMILQGTIADGLSLADVIMLTWDQLQTETMNITDTNSAYARKGAALAELFVAAGVVDTLARAAGIIAEAMVLQDLAERYFELSATDSVTMTDTEATLYRAVAENIEAAALADALAGTRRINLLISDELAGGDTADINVVLQAALADNAVFGGTIVLPDGVFSAVVLNTESLGISEYTNYPFNSFGKLGQDYLGASDTNIYRLTGDDDAGTDIDAVIRTGMTNFGTNVFKRVPRAYLGYTSDGGMIMKTISTSGGVKTERWYELTPRTGDNVSDAHAAARIKLGRGIKATYWQFELTNKLGSDFDIDTLQLYPMILSRRV